MLLPGHASRHSSWSWRAWRSPTLGSPLGLRRSSCGGGDAPERVGCGAPSSRLGHRGRRREGLASARGKGLPAPKMI